MTNLVDAILRAIMAVIMGIAAVLTTIILSPFMLLMWIFKTVNELLDDQKRR